MFLMNFVPQFVPHFSYVPQYLIRSQNVMEFNLPLNKNNDLLSSNLGQFYLSKFMILYFFILQAL